MITDMRHKLVLTLYSTVALAGLAAFGIGALSFGGVILFSLMHLPTAALSGFRIDFAAGLAMGWGLLALVGGVIGWYGFTTWRRRKAEGPAPESASVGKSLIGRIFGAIVFGGVALYFGATLYFMLGDYARDAQLASGGVTATARITEYEPDPAVHEDLFRVHYAFDTPDGGEITGWGYQWSSQVTEHKKSGSVPVTYIPGNPEIRKMDHAFDLKSVIETVLQNFSVLCVGVWGFGRNMGLWGERRPPTGSTGGGARPVTTKSLPAAIPAGRKVFGRRAV